MKRFFAILLLIAGATAPQFGTAHGQQNGPARHDDEAAEAQASRSVAAAQDAVVELSLNSGNVIVRGWAKTEVRASSTDARRIELRQYEAHDSSKAAGKDAPARRVEVFVLDSADDVARPGQPSGSGNLELDVPQGATVVLRLQSGDVEVSGVAETRVRSASGDVDLSRITRAVNVELFSGDIALADSRGGVRLKSLSGTVEATNVSPNDERDFFIVESVSGDIALEGVTHGKVEGRTVSGGVRFAGALANGGSYTFQTTSGDVTVAVPDGSSFRVNARVVLGGDIFTDFPVKADATGTRVSMGARLEGVVGTGAAELNLTSHNGTVHLRKK
jgi:hypothetical protein